MSSLSHAATIRQLGVRLGLPARFTLFGLAGYYGLTVVSALLDGVGMVFLVSLFMTGGELGSEAGVPSYIAGMLQTVHVEAGSSGAVLLLVAIYAASLVARFALLSFDGWVGAALRRRIQEKIFENYIGGDWSYMRDFSVGDAVGTNTQEAMLVAKYLTAAVSAGYFLLSAVVIGGLALVTSPAIFLAFGLIALPLVLLMQFVIARQATYSRRSAELRNLFSGDIADRFNGLLQIHVESSADFHIARGLRMQPEISRLDVLAGYCQAALGSFNLLLPLLCLIILLAWLAFSGQQHLPSLTLAASVGILGIRLANQLNGVVAAGGTLSRLSGSIFPVLGALDIPQAPARAAIPEPVGGVIFRSVSYAYGETTVLQNVSLSAKTEAPLVLVGRSGKGKTTLANLIAGLYFPAMGDVCYVGTETGKEYSSRAFRARVGYVTQDIYLFQGSLRENLTSGRTVEDDVIWCVLRLVDAEDFVRALGGLDAESTEAGRSLSGGQRRRLGIARVLLSECEILIFDEITSGLDQQNRAAIRSLVEQLAASHLVVLISHEDIDLPGEVRFAL